MNRWRRVNVEMGNLNSFTQCCFARINPICWGDLIQKVRIIRRRQERKLWEHRLPQLAHISGFLDARGDPTPDEIES